MRIWGKLVAAAVAPLMLGGCLWGPGKFTSNLAVNKAGTFVLDYRGEIYLQMPDKTGEAGVWRDDMASCYADGRAELNEGGLPTTIDVDEDIPEEAESDHSGDPRDCTPAELARLKSEYDKKESERLAKRAAENAEMAKLFGIPGSDDESNRRFAANLMKQKGWRSVTYKGKGMFDVDYHVEGRLDQDFAFPLMPDSDLMIPFITIRPRTDGSIKIAAPAFVGGPGVFAARAKMMGLPNKGNDGPPSRAEGRFTVTTDGEILTNNSEDGPANVQGRRQLHWEVDSASDKVPETMIKP